LGGTSTIHVAAATSVVDPVSVADIEPRSTPPAEVHVKLALHGVDPLISVDPPLGPPRPGLQPARPHHSPNHGLLVLGSGALFFTTTE
jgi:hypothetical protein